MITRKPSKIIDSVVNSSHEEHLNVSKAIRDDAPITNLTSCVKSINFEADGDGAYILRKPLIKKESLKSLTTPIEYPFEFYLADKEHKAIINTHIIDEEDVPYIQIPGASKIILKFYDNDLKEHKMETIGDFLDIEWLTIKSTFNTSDHTIINGVINHRTFLEEYSTRVIVTRQTTKWSWTLVNATGWAIRPAGRVSKTLTNLKRFLKIYESVDEDNTFILEIVHPELNTFTSGLDVGNTGALETNLLLDNPYAIRDLYGYGYLSVTKIVPYVVNATLEQEATLDLDDLESCTIWDLTENDFVPTSETNIPTQHFRMLVSTNPSIFKNKFLILKAFLTTAVSNVDYYCCWEESSNGGIDWEVCQEFIDKFELTEEDEKTVSDLTSKEFNNMAYKESLTEAQSYIVKKKLYHMVDLKDRDYHQDDKILVRPDVLIIENPDLSKLYRFVIYVDSNKQTPDPISETFTQPIPQFDTLSGDIPGTDGHLKFEVINNSEQASIEDRCIELHEGTQELPAPVDGEYSQFFPNLTAGDALHIYSDDPLYKLKAVTYTLAPSRVDTSVTPNKSYNLVSLVGISSNNVSSSELNLPTSKQTGTEDTVFENPYGLKYNIKYDIDYEGNIDSIKSNTIYDNYLVYPSATKTIQITNIDNVDNLYISNIIACLYDISSVDHYPYPLEQVGAKVDFGTMEEYMNPRVTFMYNGQEVTVSGEYLGTATSSVDYSTVYRYKIVRIEKLQNKKFKITGNIIVYFTQYTGGSVHSIDTSNSITYDNIDAFNIGIECGMLMDSEDKPTYATTGKSCRLRYYYDFSNITDFSEDDPFLKTPTLYNDFYRRIREEHGITVTDLTQTRLKIKNITVTYTKTENILFTSAYMTSITGSYQVPYSNTTELAIDLTSERDKIFATDSNFYYNENQAQLLVYNDNFVYASGTNSAVMKLMNSLSLPEEVTKIISWRGYLLLFSPRNIYLAKYNSSIDGYDVKVLSNTVGVSRIDADTIVPVLNSVYFKSGNKIYRLVPNLYAASDDILNIHQVSTGINNILEDITNVYEETHNFSYADADTYMVFIPIQTSNITICICYDFVKQVWTMQKYPKYLSDIEKFSNIEIYLKDNNTLYYFKDSMAKIMSEARADTDPDLDTILHTIPYSDYLTTTPTELIDMLDTATIETYSSIRTPIQFEIDFGQKSSNYTMDKQFLESKLILATLSSKDNFPLTIDIYTDGVSRELHWDANTDGALIKSGLDSYGVLNTSFVPDGADYNGIFKQLIVKYSGKGKSIRHVISGQSKTLFKFYSMNVRARILPKKR